MKIDPNYCKLRSVTEAEIVEQCDLGGCEVCEERFYSEPAPLIYPDCRTCSDKPSCHHGRCCPERHRQRKKERKFRESQSPRPIEDTEAVSYGPPNQHDVDETETREESLERPVTKRRVIGH